MKIKKNTAGQFMLKHLKIVCFLLIIFSVKGYAQTAETNKKEAMLTDSIAMELKKLEAEISYAKGNEKRQNGDRTGAIADYTQTIVLNPKHEGAYTFRALCKILQADFSGCIEDCSMAIEVKPDLYLANYYRAMAKQQLKDYSGAIQDFTRVIEINPRSGEGYFNRGLSQLMLHDKVSACWDFGKAVSLKYTDAIEMANENCR